VFGWEKVGGFVRCWKLEVGDKAGYQIFAPRKKETITPINAEKFYTLSIHTLEALKGEIF
jgi:hypothetical protein